MNRQLLALASRALGDRGALGLPHGWVERMKRSIMSLAWRYGADRMVTDYVAHSYLAAAGGRCSA